MWKHKTFSSETENTQITHEEVRNMVCNFMTNAALLRPDVIINELIVGGILIITVYWQ